MRARVEEDERGRRIVAEPCAEPCAIEQGMRVLGGKWTGSILWHLRADPVRFNDLARMIGGASKKMIADRLRHLEAHGLIRREVMPTAPVSVRYSMTDHGRTALAVLEALQAWSEHHVINVTTDARGSHQDPTPLSS
ncbi:MAG: helix-turn-helix domain-containing protein [Pseudomonadota bacterium]